MTTTTTKRVAVALSGGVDSSVAAALLLQQGYDVEGVTMRLLPLWMDSAHDDETAERAKAVCESLGIIHHVIDVRDSFESEVIQQYAQEYGDARTPNPCIVCNESIKFGLLWNWAFDQGFDFFATGHYADTDDSSLKRPKDRVKDQTYFMYRIPRERLKRILFPLADMTKAEVKAYAEELSLPSAKSRESQDACFIEKGDRHEIVNRWCPSAFECGEIITTEGAVVGTHEGIANYTVGQRKGLRVGGLDEPYYVTRLEADTNQVVIGQRAESEITKIQSSDFVIDERALGGSVGKWDVCAMARYNMKPILARLEISEGNMTIELQSPIGGVSLGQSAVCYVGDIVVAGGVITCVD